MYPPRTKKRGPVQRFKGGRVCKKNGCKQKLSIYNSAEYCHVHQAQSLGIVR